MKNNVSKVIAVLFVIIIMFCLSACNTQKATPPAQPTPNPCSTTQNGFPGYDISPNNGITWQHINTMFFSGKLNAYAYNDFTITTKKGKYVASSTPFEITRDNKTITIYAATFFADPKENYRVTNDVTIYSEIATKAIFNCDPSNDLP